jgi:hypothetical protein
MPPEFHFREDQELWANLREGAVAAGPEVEVFGKQKRGITSAGEQAEFDVLTAQGLRKWIQWSH